ncbi:unnamed protein product, partial [marine sediment metagenome]
NIKPMSALAEWRDIFEIPVIEDRKEKVEKFLIERKSWDAGLEINVTRIKDGAMWGKAISESEYKAWKYVDDYLLATRAGPHKRLLSAIGILGGGTSTFFAGLFGWSRGYASRLLSELRRKNLTNRLPPRRTTLIKIPEVVVPPLRHVERAELTPEEVAEWERQLRGEVS